MERQTDIASQTLALTQRPRIIVRNFHFTQSVGTGGAYHTLSAVEPGSLASGQFYIVNIGGTEALVRELVCKTYISRDGELPMKRPYEAEIGNQAVFRIRPGETASRTFASKAPLTDEETRPFFTLDSVAKFFVLGWVGYTDNLGVYRFTYFCRSYAPIHGGRFAPVSDPDYENAD